MTNVTKYTRERRVRTIVGKSVRCSTTTNQFYDVILNRTADRSYSALHRLYTNNNGITAVIFESSQLNQSVGDMPIDQHTLMI